MIKILNKIWHYFLVFVIASIFSFFLFYLFLHPISISSLIETRLGFATQSPNSTSATVSLNPFNRLAMQLDAKEKELALREKELTRIEQEIIDRSSLLYNRLLLSVLVVLVILASLILLNFYFDYKRQKRLKEERNKQKTV